MSAPPAPAGAGASDCWERGRTGSQSSTGGSDSPSGTPLLELRGVKQGFGAVQALNGVDLEILPGKVTALVGDNGAGKSCLIKTISGLWEPDEGEILWEGKPVHIRTPKDAEALGHHDDLPGPGAVRQPRHRPEHVPRARAAAARPARRGRHGDRRPRKTLAELSVTTVRSIRQPVASLSGGQRQSVAVAKAVMSNAKLVIMDEPTAALGVAQTAQVLDLIKRLAAQGVAVIVVSHNLNDVFAVADRIAILYLGRMVASGPASAVRPPGGRRLHDDRSIGRAVAGGADGRRSADNDHRSGGSRRPDLGTRPRPRRARLRRSRDLTTTRRRRDIARRPGAPDVLADSLGEYLTAWVKRIRSGESGALPIIVGLIVIVIIFQVERSRFLSAGNIVNLLVQAAFFVTAGHGRDLRPDPQRDRPLGRLRGAARGAVTWPSLAALLRLALVGRP